MGKVKITLTKSLIGRLDKQKKTAASLGLKKIGDTTLQPEGPVTDGKIFIIKHLVSVERDAQ
ncbi:MAG: 50S ribosomal protein L30 [Clostridia bacterium]|nr:50S ribosomal protein L30 [Clostridia bacterium]